MDNDLLSKSKLIDWLEEKIESYFLAYHNSYSDYDQGREASYHEVIESVRSGLFDPDPTPSPTIKPGDKVRIISALAREWIGREAVVTEVYTEPFLSFSLDVGGGHWTSSCLEVIESD